MYFEGAAEVSTPLQQCSVECGVGGAVEQGWD